MSDVLRGMERLKSGEASKILLFPNSNQLLLGMTALLLALHGAEAAAIEFQQVSGIVLGLGDGAALEPGAGRAHLSIAGCYSNELHHVEGYVFVTAGTNGDAGNLVCHECLQLSESGIHAAGRVIVNLPPLDAEKSYQSGADVPLGISADAPAARRSQLRPYEWQRCFRARRQHGDADDTRQGSSSDQVGRQFLSGKSRLDFAPFTDGLKAVPFKAVT